jgi:hypothetical protein
MSNRMVVTDDKTGQEIPQGMPYFHVTVKYYENDLQYQTAAPKFLYLDTLLWSDVVGYLQNGIPATAIEVTVLKR